MKATHFIALVLAALLAAVSSAACQGYGEPAADEPRTVRLMVFPAPDGALDPATDAGLERLSVAAGIPLAYLGRGGGGYVVVTEEPVDRTRLQAIVRRLLDHPAVAHAEEDRRVTTQNTPEAYR